MAYHWTAQSLASASVKSNAKQLHDRARTVNRSELIDLSLVLTGVKGTIDGSAQSR